MFDFSAFFAQYGNLFLQGTVDTLIMTCVATILAYVIGTPLHPSGGDQPERLRPNRIVSTIVGWIVNIGARFLSSFCSSRSSRSHALSWEPSLGVPGAVVPLVVTAAPFAARMVEQSLEETDSGLVEAAQSFGASTWQIVWKVYLKETLPSLVRGAAITFVTLFGYSAMAGTVGAGGLGRYRHPLRLSALPDRRHDLRRAFVRCARHRVPGDRRCDRTQDRQAPQVTCKSSWRRPAKTRIIKRSRILWEAASSIL